MTTKGPVHAMVLAVTMSLVVGCTDGLRGVPMKSPAATGKLVASLSTNQFGGLIVLWDDESLDHREAHSQPRMAWVAGNAEEFEDVWNAAASGKPPRVDFATHVVFAMLHEGNYADPKLSGIDVEASGLMVARFVSRQDGDYLDNVSPMALIFALPRRIFPTTVVFFQGFAFEVPEVPFG